jgi:signal transduction histidine kinase
VVTDTTGEVAAPVGWGVFGPRPLLFVGKALLATGLIAAFSYVTLSAQSDSRRQAEGQFRAEATVTARLTSALFGSSVAAATQQAQERFGDAHPSVSTLNAAVKSSHLLYARILDGSGETLAVSTGAPSDAGLPEADRDAVRHALAGEAWLSNVLPAGTASAAGGVVELAVPFNTRFGRRVQISAFNVSVLSGFLTTTLGDRQVESRVGSVVDDNGHLIATSDPRRGAVASIPADATSGTYSQAGSERYFTSAPIAGASWRVVLSESTGQLYPALAGSRALLLFGVIAAFGIAALGSLFFFRRALIGEARLAAKNLELSMANSTLEQKVAERTEASEERARQLAESNSELEQFASVASHDLQEPLRKIRMFGDRLMKRLSDDLPEEAASDARRIQDAAARMQRLIDDLLAFARVSSRDRQYEPVDLNQITAEVLDDLEARIAELGADVQVGPLPVIEGDAAQMRQLIQNLLSNALKFHRPEEPPRIRISSETSDRSAPRFDGELTMPARCAVVIEDNGIGFDPQYSDRIFSTFERLHSRADYDGTGIGLSIARKIAWRHRGDITAIGRPGHGATFTVTLPLNTTDIRVTKEAPAHV